MDWYIGVWKKYAVFEGRARRMEYWIFNLINLLVTLLLAGIDAMTGMGWMGPVYGLAVILPSLAVTVRRLHDTNRSGWWILINLIPLIGPIILLVFMCLDGDEYANDYGPNPKYWGA